MAFGERLTSDFDITVGYRLDIKEPRTNNHGALLAAVKKRFFIG